MTKMACRLKDLRMWKGSKGGCEAATNICSAIQVRKSGQIKRMQCEGIEGTCECKRRSTVASLATYLSLRPTLKPFTNIRCKSYNKGKTPLSPHR